MLRPWLPVPFWLTILQPVASVKPGAVALTTVPAESSLLGWLPAALQPAAVETKVPAIPAPPLNGRVSLNGTKRLFAAPLLFAATDVIGDNPSDGRPMLFSAGAVK